MYLNLTYIHDVTFDIEKEYSLRDYGAYIRWWLVGRKTGLVEKMYISGKQLQVKYKYNNINKSQALVTQGSLAETFDPGHAFNRSNYPI